MNKEFFFTAFSGLVYVLLLSLPVWNKDFLFSQQLGDFNIIQPLVHIILFIGLLFKFQICRKIMLVLLGLSIFLSLYFLANDLNIIFSSFVIVSIGAFILLWKSNNIKLYLASKQKAT